MWNERPVSGLFVTLGEGECWVTDVPGSQFGGRRRGRRAPACSRMRFFLAFGWIF